MTSDISLPNANNVLDVDMEYDGAWMTRGHKSHVSTGFIIKAHTGMIIDYRVLCNYCNTCQLNKQHHFHKNFKGGSAAMEKEAAVHLWARSSLHHFRYNAVCYQNNGCDPYDNVTVVREECLHHVSKCLGSRLRKMKNKVATYKLKLASGGSRAALVVSACSPML